MESLVSVDSGVIPSIWEKPLLFRQLRNHVQNKKNDFGPVTLASAVMKTFERIMIGFLRKEVNDLLNSCQFAYCDGRGTDDALSTLSTFNLENPSSYVRILLDLSSAFNTIIPKLLIQKLVQRGVNHHTIKWYLAFFARKTAAGQNQVHIIRLTGSEYRGTTGGSKITSPIYSLHKRPQEQLLKVLKTKEMNFDPKAVRDVVSIKGQEVEQVLTYKYLGIHFDSHLHWANHVDHVCAKINQRLHFLRRLRLHGVEKKVMLSFYRACIKSFIECGISTQVGNLTVKLKSQFDKESRDHWVASTMYSAGMFEETFVKRAENSS